MRVKLKQILRDDLFFLGGSAGHCAEGRGSCAVGRETTTGDGRRAEVPCLFFLRFHKHSQAIKNQRVIETYVNVRNVIHE